MMRFGHPLLRWSLAATVLLAPASCGSAQAHWPFEAERVARFDDPWALAFLPDGQMLVTEKAGRLFRVTRTGQKAPIGGVPQVDYGGQGGLGDVAVHPDYEENHLVYLSYAEPGEAGTRGAAVARARLGPDADALTNVEVIWRQVPKVRSRGHYGHRLLIDRDGYLWISSGDRQTADPAQDLRTNLGKILRLHDDGSLPADNPFQDQGEIARQVWSLGHRNPLGLAFDSAGQLWNSEMGPRGGDELNRVVRGANYGWPIVSNGRHYSGRGIPDHDTRPDFAAPAVWWTPVISPGGLMIYSGELFEDWRGDAFLTGLSARALIRVEFDGVGAREAERFEMRRRVRAVAQGPDGAIWTLDDGGSAWLLRLTPKGAG
ncbi:MAG TPA: PQQ-dependent sugar dehydrogenase [Longimicrobiales bacterium]|nr:PQQ-dependent sugar dehydrogenase [Longimicrobiales bacterium]